MTVQTMTPGPERPPLTSSSRADQVGRWLCVAGALLGALGLLETATGTRLLSVAGGGEMTANGALCLLLLGGSSALRNWEGAPTARRVVSLLAAVAVLAIGIATLFEYALDVDLRVDRLIAAGGGPERHPGRPPPAAALALAFLAGGLALLSFRPPARARSSEWLVLAAGYIALTSVLGFVFGAELHHDAAHAPLIGAPLPTALGLLLVSLGVLLEHPSARVMRVAKSSGPGGLQFRRFALPAVTVPIVLGAVVIFPLRTLGGDALSVVVAVLASAMTLVGLFVLLGTAVSLNRTYESLESSRAATQALVEQAPDAVFVADVTGRYTEVNSAGCRLLGFTRDEILGMSVADLLLPADRKRLAETRSQLLQGGVEHGEWALRRRDGSYVATEISAKIFPDGRWQGLVRDISERKRLEEELRQAEAAQKFLAELGSALVSTIDDRETVEVVAQRVVADLADACSIETLDEDGQLYDRVVAHRDPDRAAVCRRLENVPLDRARPYLGSAVRMTKRPMLVGVVTSAYLDSIAQGAEHRQLLRELDPRSFLALPLLAHGGVVGSLVFISTTRDAAFREHDLPFAQEVAIRAALAVEKARIHRVAQQAIRLREDVLSVVAHDLRNPLGTILMQTALLRRRAAGLDARARKPADVIERAATRMNHLIQDLLDVARMEGGQLAIEQERVSARQVIADSLQAQQPLAAAAAMQLRVEAAADLPELWADRNRLLQIFENLIGNAIKFTEAGGRITVGAVPGEGHVLFWVADTGAGIAAEHLPRLFERLWQASKTGQLGAGLGLPIVKGIVEAHGGHIWVESKVGAGSTFFFTIPEAPAAERWGAEPAPPGP